ncbi:hypothetical protein PC9H_001067 [Pleurotus ostreatus]|uniref:Uncharacterized protein n=1 Tax=Pleurotus ostreatus TaxID=5322 RepID=A0A8H7DVV5_PLEOS|nr:uncharacterized protein PC9H_001067 [Pleurotus ostreatus]KAF7440719.1 hypothetical protein PC9H_001067 [Pleurotus ostreatus]KAJ8699886.1 hypothetical protein PTI98_002963 [Pleurotus ostreatus]
MPPTYRNTPTLITLFSRLAPRRDEFKYLNDHTDSHNGHRNGPKKVAQTNFDSKHSTSKSASHQEKVLAQDLAKGKPEDDAGETSMTAIPVPIPDTGSHHSDSTDKNKPHSKSSSISEHSMTTSSLVSATSLLLPTTTVFSSAPPTDTISSTFQSVSVIPSSAAHPSLAGPHLSTLAIALLASGAACIIVALFIIIKVCSRPRRRTPTPSLPILEDGFDDIYKPGVEDSPLFGGKERISHLDNNGFSPWPKDLQAPQWPPEPVQTFNTAPNNTSHWMQRREVDYAFNGHAHSQGSTYEPNIVSPRPIRQMQDAITRVTRRLSAASLHPGGNPSTEATGLGIGDSPPLTADGYQVMERKSRSVSRKSVNGSEPLPQGRRQSQSLRQSMGLAYDGADVLSPCSHDVYVPSEMITPIAIAEPSPAHGGRSRIKSSYFTSYPRSSAAPMFANAGALNHVESSEASLHRSESRRDRDTKALAAALGLSSPSPICPPPPSPTIHPDDSLSMLGRRFSKAIPSRSADSAAGGDAKPRHSLSAMSPRSPSSVLGNLMLVDFGATSKSLANIGFGESTRQSYASSKIPTSMSKKSLYDDRPPRVPSPPPLPSLAQMGLEKSCPETFASYRSPTYSIFGLYEDSRRSVLR